jgi:hypothetical protein
MRLAGIIALNVLTAAPAAAQNLQTRDCNAANIAFVVEAIGKMPDSKQKATASQEIDAAKQAMTDGHTDDCKDHLLKATLQTK